MSIYFISDFYKFEITGGAEICNDVLLKKLKNYNILTLKSREITIDFLKKQENDFYIIANFFQLSDECKSFLIQKRAKKYIIYEHDHKYVSTNNPTIFPNFIIDEEFLINKQFYKNAKAVLCQSKIHSEIIVKNLLLNNVINLAGNLWNKDDISILEKNLNNNKTIEYAIFHTNNKNKGMQSAIDFCNKNNLKYSLIPLQEYPQFIENLSKVKNLIFFPQWLETFSRISVEAKILGCKLITNKLVGASSEEFFKFQPKEILKHIESHGEKIVEVFLNLLEDKQVEYFQQISLPKISIITSLYKGGEFIENFLSDITRQSIFKTSCELLILDANSPDNEYEIISKYLKLYDNIKYYKFDTRLNVHETLNFGVENSCGDYITIANVDDRRNIDCLETLSKHLYNNSSIDLVYGDCIQTQEKNEFVENCKSNILYQHSANKFSKENMIKCLPGPIPMWRKTMSIENGFFDKNLKYAGDWEYWLRCVRNKSVFKKINFIAGSYYINPKGLSTNPSNLKDKFQEERKIFLDYKDIIGYNNFEKYRSYFNV